MPSSSPWQFRRATAADVPAVVALIESAYRGDASRAGWTTEADLLEGRRTSDEEVRSCIERARSLMLLAERDGRLAACAHVTALDDAGYFGMFSVVPTLQGAGLGKRVLAEAERVVRAEWRLPVMRLSAIDVRTELIAYYERRGYVRTGVTMPFPYGEADLDRPKRRGLRLIVLEKVLEKVLSP